MTSLSTRRFATLVAETQRIFQDTSSANLRAACKDAINRALDSAASLFDWPQLVEADESGVRILSDSTLPSLLSGDSFMPAPYAAGRLRSLVVQGAHSPPVEIVTPDELYHRAGVQLAFEVGVPRFAAQVGVTAQTRRLASDGALTCYSSSASNDGTKTVRVYFQKSSAPLGGRSWADVTGTFSTGVQLGGGATLEAGYPIKSITLPTGWAGTCEIRDGSGTSLVLVPSVEEPSTNTNSLPQTIQRALLKVFPTPDADYPATVIWWRVPLMLTEDEDVPELPIGSFLVARAAADIFGQQGKLAESALWEGRAMTALRSTLQQQSGHKRQQSVPAGGNILAQTSYRWN